MSDIINQNKINEPTEPTEQTKSTEPTEPTEQTKSTEQTKKHMSKAGRTLLVNSNNNSNISGKNFDSLEGLVNKTETKTSNSFFLTFDTVPNALNAFRKLRSDNTSYRVKFSYYRIFFTIEGLSNSNDYLDVKEKLCEYIVNKTDASVIYCKFYRKNNEFIGCGDLTVDTYSAMNKLVTTNDDNNNEYSFDLFKGKFYRYNNNKGKTT